MKNLSQQIEFIVLIISILFSFTSAHIIQLSANEQLKVQCSSTSVKIFYTPRPSHSISLITHSTNENCEKSFGIDEKVHFKLDFKTCTSGAKKFNLIVVEFSQNKDKLPFTNQVVIDCQKYP